MPSFTSARTTGVSYPAFATLPIGVFHELPHIERVNNGTFSKYGGEGARQEVEAIRFENIGQALIDGSQRSENMFNHDIIYR
jgi:hypothetical protein